MSLPQKFALSLHECSLQRLFRIRWKRSIFNDQLVQLVPQKISTLRASMPIIDRKKTTARPHINFLKLRLNDVQYNTDSIFIVVAHHALVSIRCIGGNNSIFLAGELGWVVLRLKFSYLHALHRYVLISLLVSHFHASIVHYLLLSGTILHWLSLELFLIL